MSHYLLSKIKEQNLKLAVDAAEGLEPGSGLGSGKAKDKKEESLSQIIQRLNEVFSGEGLTEDDMVSYFHTIKSKVHANAPVMKQITKNTREQIMLGDYPLAVDDALFESSEAHQKQFLKLMKDPEQLDRFKRLLLDMVLHDVQSGNAAPGKNSKGSEKD